MAFSKILEISINWEKHFPLGKIELTKWKF